MINNLRQEKIIVNHKDFFASCHASTLVALEDGAILCAYMAGDKEGAPNMSIWLSKYKAGWQSPIIIQSRYLLPHWNPVLFYDSGRTHLHYKVGTTVHNWYTLYSYSDDQGISWSEPTEAVAGDHNPRVCVRTKLVKTSSGHLVGTCSVERGDCWDSFVDISRDGGKTWKKHNIPINHLKNTDGVAIDNLWEGLTQGDLWENNLKTIGGWDGIIQPTLWEGSPGQLHILMRSTRGKIYRSDSLDNGENWSEAYPTLLPNNNSGIDVVKLGDGRLILIYNPIGGNWAKRNIIAISISSDNGKEWSSPLVLHEEPTGEFSYPAIVEHNNKIYFSYTYNRINIVSGSFEVKK